MNNKELQTVSVTVGREGSWSYHPGQFEGRQTGSSVSGEGK